MSMTNKSHRLLVYLAASLLAFTGATANAAEDKPPGLLETFACNFHDGQDMDDLLSARDNLIRQAERADVTPRNAFVWTRFKGGPDFDFVWLTVHQDLAAFAAVADGDPLPGVGERFQAVAECQTGIMGISPVFLGADTDGPNEESFVSVSACSPRPGVGPDDIADLNGHISGVLGNLDTHKSFVLFAGTPMTPGPNTPDMFYFGVSDSASAWANGVNAIRSAGGSLGRHFNGTLDCDQSLWFSQQVVAPPAAD